MEMRFCPRCRTKLIPGSAKRGVNAGLVNRCPKCDYVEDPSSDVQESEASSTVAPERGVVVLNGEEEQLKTMPTTRIDCPQCHNNLAYFWQVQTRSGDEGATQFFRCTKCNHTWRVYS